MNKLNWVQGNKLKLSIPLTIVNMDNGESIPYKPQDGDKVRVFLKSMLRSYEYQPTIESESNTLTIEDNGQLEIGTYSVEIFVTEKGGTLRRSKWNKVIQIHDDNSKVLSEYDDFPEYADGAIIEGDDALSVKELYPRWEDKIGKTIEMGYITLYNGNLWKARQTHVAQEIFPPSLDTASLYEVIVKNHEGTKDDPIPFTTPMEIFKDKYYTQDGVLYLCIRDSGIALTHNLKDLVGIYVEA